MSTSFKVTVRLRDTTNDIDYRESDLAFTSTGGHEHADVLTIGTSEETITINTDITGGNGPAYVYLKNEDATNFIEVGFATTVYPMKLDPGDGTEVALLPMNSTGFTQLFVKADTAACKLRFKITER